MSIIEWCNLNEGFINAVLAIISLLLSCVAIGVSIQAIRLPFKKKLKVECYLGFVTQRPENNEGIIVTVTNVSNRDIVIYEISLKNHKHKRIIDTTLPITEINFILHTGDTKTRFFGFEEFRNSIIGLGLPIYGYARDTSGKIYKKRLKEKFSISDGQILIKQKNKQ